MRILFTSDIHANSAYLFFMLSMASKEKADAVIIAGDIIPHSLPHAESVDILQAQGIYLRHTFIPTIRDFRQKRDIPIYLDLGNDDFIDTRKILEEYDGEVFHLLHWRKHLLADGVDIIGYMNVPPTPFGRKDFEKPDVSGQPYAPGNLISLNGCISENGMLKEASIDLASNDTIENDLIQLSEMIEQPFIFVSHSPPYQTPLDVLYDGTHVGSVAIKRFIREWSEKGQLIASFHGHIHESPKRSGSIRTKIGDSICFNPGQDGNGDFRYMIFELGDSRTPSDILVFHEP